MDAVAGFEEGVQGGDYREGGADGGFVVEEAAGWGGGGVVEGVPEGEGVAEGFFVGGYDADATGEEVGVAVCEGLGACVVD